MAYQFHLAFHTRYFAYICQFILHFCRLLLWQLPSPISATQKIASWLGDHTEFKYNKKKKNTKKFWSVQWDKWKAEWNSKCGPQLWWPTAIKLYSQLKIENSSKLKFWPESLWLYADRPMIMQPMANTLGLATLKPNWAKCSGKVAGALASLDRHMQIATDSRFKCSTSRSVAAQKEMLKNRIISRQLPKWLESWIRLFGSKRLLLHWTISRRKIIFVP